MPHPKAMRPIPFSLALSLVLSVACGGAEWEVRRGVIRYAVDDPLSLELPATIMAGQATTLTIRTQGLGDCTRPVRTDTRIAGMVVTVEPYDSVYIGDLDCLTVPCHCVHSIDVTFPDSGTGTLRVIGLQQAPYAVVTVDSVLDVR